MRFAAPLLCLALAAPAWAQSPPRAVLAVSPPGPVPPGTLVVIDATATVGEALDWDADAPEETYREDTGHRLLYFAPRAPGSYPIKVVAYSIVDGKVRISKARATVVVSGVVPPGPAPQPTPPDPDPRPPTPTPGPAPAPLAPGWHATLVRDSNAPLPSLQALAPLVESATIAGSVRALGGRWHVVDVLSAEYGRRNLARYQSAPPPCLVVQDASGKVLGTSALAPGSAGPGGLEADVLARLRSVAAGGK